MRNNSFSRKLLFQKIGEINIEIDLSCLRGLAISPGVTVSTLKKTATGDIESGNSFEATEMGRSEDPSSPQFWNNFMILQSASTYPFGAIIVNVLNK